ncbi:UDP-N-acetylmuramate dehydrogenase [bacterium]|nr:MAG: UDP-N-acetylmuramate dehydrogenase [bacterium]
MQITENAQLAPYTTFYIGGPARYLIFAQDDSEVIEAIKFVKSKNLPHLIFGGGSNMLVSDNGFDGVAIRIESVGMDIIEDSPESVTLKIASGEVWDDAVRLAVEENWWGIENLSHIPGFVGAFCVQNVGAYGQEASDVVQSAEVYDIERDEVLVMPAADLNFGYRSSIFNTTQKGRYIILSTTIKLIKNGKPNLSYGDLASYFQNFTPSIEQIREAVIEIRNKKFPFPSEPTKGNSGSFFRGPLLSRNEFVQLNEKIKQNFPEAADKFDNMENKLKVSQGYKTPAAFLIDLCGLKGKTVGGAKINEDQPAIILNFTGHATSDDVMTLYKEVSSVVYEKTGVNLGMEPELVGFKSEK